MGRTALARVGRTSIPVAFIAVGLDGSVLGGVGIHEFDLEERRDRSPWIVGTIVRADRRGEGIGQALMARLEAWANAVGIERLWVLGGRRARWGVLPALRRRARRGADASQRRAADCPDQAAGFGGELSIAWLPQVSAKKEVRGAPDITLSPQRQSFHIMNRLRDNWFRRGWMLQDMSMGRSSAHTLCLNRSASRCYGYQCLSNGLSQTNRNSITYLPVGI